jgi:hypothetical protein
MFFTVPTATGMVESMSEALGTETRLALIDHEAVGHAA